MFSVGSDFRRSWEIRGVWIHLLVKELTGSIKGVGGIAY